MGRYRLANMLQHRAPQCAERLQAGDSASIREETAAPHFQDRDAQNECCESIAATIYLTGVHTDVRYDSDFLLPGREKKFTRKI